MASPGHIICLTAESADWLWRIGAWDRVAGVSAFFKAPPGLPPRPKISAFNSANVEQIMKLGPDLVITFSDVQAALAAEFIRRGVPVLATNQRSLAEVEATLAMLGRLAGCEPASEQLLEQLRKRLAPVETTRHRLRAYFEEWEAPATCGIAWISELMERAGADDIFGHLRCQKAASGRRVSFEDIRGLNPEIIFASWCGKPVHTGRIARRPGWGEVTAVREGRIHKMAGENILQPGFRLVYGYEQIKRRLAEVRPAR